MRSQAKGLSRQKSVKEKIPSSDAVHKEQLVINEEDSFAKTEKQVSERTEQSPITQ